MYNPISRQHMGPPGLGLAGALGSEGKKHNMGRDGSGFQELLSGPSLIIGWHKGDAAADVKHKAFHELQNKV